MKDEPFFTRRLAIIGIGPRGLYALENFVYNLRVSDELSDIHILLFEETGSFGSGPIYDIDQEVGNWLNIPERKLKLPARKEIKYKSILIPSFPSYPAWTDQDFSAHKIKEEDIFPPRSKLGLYLSQRFESLVFPLIKAGVIEIFKEKITGITYGKKRMTLHSDLQDYADIDEILLSIGHQPTELSKELKEWKAFAAHNNDLTVFPSPYPVSEILKSRQLQTTASIGIRGFGLSMIDVVRGIADHFGSFTESAPDPVRYKYSSDKPLNNLLIPFTLNGLPPVPKPLNAFVDNLFEPTENKIKEFKNQIGDKPVQKKAKDTDFLIRAFAPIAAHIYEQLPNKEDTPHQTTEALIKIIQLWLKDEDYHHALILKGSLPVHVAIERYISMACGKRAISLDYCIGQVWRHCQHSMYEALSFSDCSEEVMADIVALNERIKRYSYGPPVKSMQQLLALREANILNLDFLNDPDIEMTSEGWRLTNDEAAVTVNIMINSVLDPPEIKSVSSPLIKGLLSDDLIEAVHNDLGVETDEYGYVVSKSNGKPLPIGVIGRLATGSIIGADSILQCFGKRPEKWAEKAAENHIEIVQKRNKPLGS